MVQQLLYKYLVLNGQIGIPDIGRFIVHRHPAAVDETGRVLLSPSAQIRFEVVAVHADKNLFYFLARESGSDEVTVIAQFNEWVKLIKEQLVEESVAVLPYIGSLHVVGESVYRFDPLQPAILQQPVDLPEGILWETDTAEDYTVIETADSGWWIYAIILLLLGIAAIAYRYL
ncbi:MAG: hypothetical protein ACOYVG_03360 [Bacteroidota bacterium]|jgi:hypothetical protein